MGEHRALDAAERAELDALRLRAYGPAANALDEPALQRLVRLEELALPAMPDHEPLTIAGAEALELQAQAELPSSAARSSRKRGWPLLLGATVAVAVAVTATAFTAGSSAMTTNPPDPRGRAAAQAAAAMMPDSVRRALSFTDDASAEVLIEVRTDASYGGHISDPSAVEVPTFPAGGTVQWAQPIGEYFGFYPWIAGADGFTEAENCILLKNPTFERGYCLTSSLKAQGALLITVPFDDIDPAERPSAMTADESLGFWWGPEGGVTILLGPVQ